MTARAEKVVNGRDADLDAKVDALYGEELSPQEDDVRRYLKSIVEADIRCFYDDDNNLLPANKWPDRESTALVRLTHNPKTGNLSVQFSDPIKAAEQLAKLDGMYDQQSESRDPFTKLLESVPRQVLRDVMSEITRMAEAENEAASDAAEAPSVAPPVVSRETMAAAPAPLSNGHDPDADLDVV